MRRRFALLLVPLLASSACSAFQVGLDPAIEMAERIPGLIPIRHDDFARAFIRPRADLGSYHAVRIDPVQVEYFESPSQHTRIPRPSTTESLANEVREAFVEALGRDDGYPVVDEAGPGVLAIRLSLANVEVDGSRMVPPSGGVQVRSVGGMDVTGDGGYEAAMTVVIEVRNSDSDLLLFWARDRRSSPLGLRGSDRMSLVSRGRILAERWGRALREGLGGPPSTPRRLSPSP